MKKQSNTAAYLVLAICASYFAIHIIIKILN